MCVCYTWVYQYIDHPYHWIYYDRILINILIKYGSNIDENPAPNSIGGMTIPDGKIKHGTCGISPLLTTRYSERHENTGVGL